MNRVTHLSLELEGFAQSPRERIRRAAILRAAPPALSKSEKVLAATCRRPSPFLERLQKERPQ